MVKRIQFLQLSAVVTIVFFSVFIIMPAALVSLGYNDVFSFKLLSVNNVENPDLKCYVKSSGFTLKQNPEGTVISQGMTKQSQFYIKNPSTIFSIVDKEGVQDPITQFKTQAKMRCDITDALAPKIKLEMSTATILLEVYSQNEKQTKVLTYSESKTVNPLVLTDNKEVTLAEFTVDPYKIEQVLKTNGYNSYQEFRISGTINLNYDKYEGVVYQVQIPKDKVKVTFYTEIGSVEEKPVPSPDCPSDQLKFNGVCVPKCNDDQVLEGYKCVDKPVTPECKANEELINNQCVPKEDDEGQKDPKVTNDNSAANLFADWFNKLVLGDFASLSSPKYIGINFMFGLFIFVIIISMVSSARKPRQ